MKTIIAGGRDITDPAHVEAAINASGVWVSEVVCGGASGVDALGKAWAEANEVPVKMFPADWMKHGRAAGPIRNGEMAGYAEALIAIWDGKSRGTKNMIDQATKRGLAVYIHRIG